MTTLYDREGRSMPCTVVEGGPCIVTQIKTAATDGYEAVQLAYGERKEKNTPQSLQGHFKKAGISPKRKLVEFSNFVQDFSQELKLGQTVRLEDLFQEGEFVDVVGTAKGKGFQGVVKRHGFAGVGERTHGQHNRERAPGSIGGASYPARVFKGMRMAGQTGGHRVKVDNLKILKIIPEENIIVINGSIPGPKNAPIILEK